MNRTKAEEDRYLEAATLAPRVPWDKFKTQLQWTRDSHATIVIPTGGGKSTIINALIADRPWTVYICVKPKDATVDRLIRDHGYKVARKWSDTEPKLPFQRRHDRWVLWPITTSLADKSEQRAVIREALDAIYQEGGWTACLDETEWLTGQLHLDDDVKTLLAQGRAMFVSVVCASQRPRNLPLLAFSSATWVFLGRTNDEEDMRRLSELGGSTNIAVLRLLLPVLEEHQVVVVNTRNGDMLRTRVPASRAL